MSIKEPLIQYLESQISWQQYLDFFVRILAAGVCGAVIGYERSRRKKGAGLRTHIIVCCGAAIMMIVSKYAFLDTTLPSGEFISGTRGADSARIAAQVVSGISFIGAGVIFKNGNTVKGLTTAAGIWATAGIGLAMGSGMYAVALFSTFAIAVIQLLLHKLQYGAESVMTTVFKFTCPTDSGFKKQFDEAVAGWKGHVDEINVKSSKDGMTSYSVTVTSPNSNNVDEFVKFFEENKSVANYGVSTIT